MLTVPRPPRERAELEAATRQAFALATEDQIRLYESLRDYLGDKTGQVTERDRRLAERTAALEAMRRVAKELDLKAGQAPTVGQFNQAAARLDLDWNSQRVIRAWDRWRNAQDALRGGRVPESSSQRALRRRTSGRQRTHEDYIAGVRQWLQTKPASTTGRDYNRFVREHNDGLEDGELPLVRYQAIGIALNLGWGDILAIASGRKSLADGQREARRRVRERGGELGLIGLKHAALLLGMTQSHVQVLSRRPGFPRPVARISGYRAWRRSDIEAVRDHRSPPTRKPGELQDRLLGSREVSMLVGLKPDALRTAMHERRWQRVPRPAGQLGNVHYWIKENVEKWFTERESAGRRGARKDGS